MIIAMRAAMTRAVRRTACGGSVVATASRNALRPTNRAAGRTGVFISEVRKHCTTLD